MVQQMLVRGWAREARAEVKGEAGSEVLEIQLTPFQPVESLQVEAPLKWRESILADLKTKFQEGERFNPERFGIFLGHWVHGLVMAGAPLVDVRGSTFEAETGTVRVVVVEPVLKNLEVKEALLSESRYLQEAIRPLLGQPLRTGQLRDVIALAEQRLHLAELRYQLKPVPDGCELLLVPVRYKKQNLDVSLGYESTLGGMAGFQYGTVNFGLAPPTGSRRIWPSRFAGPSRLSWVPVWRPGFPISSSASIPA
jgi:hypothetical protein